MLIMTVGCRVSTDPACVNLSLLYTYFLWGMRQNSRNSLTIHDPRNPQSNMGRIFKLILMSLKTPSLLSPITWKLQVSHDTKCPCDNTDLLFDRLEKTGNLVAHSHNKTMKTGFPITLALCPLFMNETTTLLPHRIPLNIYRNIWL